MRNINYRSIAISSLILKIIDWVVIILFGECLGLDDLQFSYQSCSSTVMCTWLAIETIDHFLRNGGEVFSCMMDMTKAFDMVQHSLLFRKILDVKLSVIFVRLIMVMYTLQYANVRWKQLVSGIFTMVNGVKQGAVLSALLYCVHVNRFFEKLCFKRAGCWIVRWDPPILEFWVMQMTTFSLLLPPKCFPSYFFQLVQNKVSCQQV